MLMLVVPLFVLVTVLDLASVVQRRAARKSMRHWSYD
jgi:hypothetical protein